MTHDQAVQAAIEISKQNYEGIVFQKLLPGMRDQVRATYKQKEGRIGFFFAEDTLEIVLREFLETMSTADICHSPYRHAAGIGRSVSGERRCRPWVAGAALFAFPVQNHQSTALTTGGAAPCQTL